MSEDHTASRVRPSAPRQTVQVRFGPGALYESPSGTRLEEFVQAAAPRDPLSIVAALVDGELRELTWPVTRDVDAEPISAATGDGMRIYRRSLCFLLIVAAQELFPQARIVVDHSLTLGGLFCRVVHREPFDQGELEQLEGRMRAIVRADEPITCQDVPLAEAVERFRRQAYADKVRLLQHCRRDSLPIYALRGTYDYFYGYMVPSTRYLRHFALHSYPPGFILRFPPRFGPSALPPFRDVDVPKLAAVFREYGQWMEMVGIGDVGALNQAVARGRIREVILVSEALQEQRVADIAGRIASRRDGLRLVLIAGPTSSGKTTFTKRLAIQLLARGIRPLALGLDDYFLNREDTPRDAQGEPDYESLRALDLGFFNHQLVELLAGWEVTLPHYNFATGRREPGPTVRISPGCVILAEGIHGLNPNLTLVRNGDGAVSPEAIYRIYVSALTQLNLDCHNRIATTDTRLLRRIVRDIHERRTPAQANIHRWEKVVRGEFRNIFPYQEHADIMFNSALVYELAVIKCFAEPLLREIQPGSVAYVEAKRLLAFLDWFLPCGAELVPGNSILREFIGNSTLKDFRL
jgi:uridine kinase